MKQKELNSGTKQTPPTPCPTDRPYLLDTDLGKGVDWNPEQVFLAKEITHLQDSKYFPERPLAGMAELSFAVLN